MMTYKGYTASIWFEADDHAFHGVVLGVRDVIHFSGISVEEIEHAFTGSVDEYLAICFERGIDPIKPMSGKLSLRISPELHLKAAAKARESGTSINLLIENAASHAARALRPAPPRTPLSPPLRSPQGRPQSPHPKSKFLALMDLNGSRNGYLGE